VPLRVLYILPRGRTERLQRREHKFPNEFFYGYCQLALCERWQVELMTREVHSNIGVGLQKLLHWFTHLSPDFGNAAALSATLIRRFDAIISMNEPVLLMLALRKQDRLDGAGLVLIQMGADKRIEQSRFPAATRRILKWLYGRLAAVIVLGEGERDYLLQQKLVEPGRLHLVQFGVDAKFWTPAEAGGEKDYLLAIGNDDGRDYETLLKAIGQHPLRLHTTRALDEALIPPNVICTKGDWHKQALSDRALRDLYRGSRFVVTPLHDFSQPQGQSVTLQAMACGKAVILSRTKGLWSRELMRHMDNCYLVPSGDVAALREAIDRLDGDADLRTRLGKAARQSVERYFLSDLMAERIGAVLESVGGQAGALC